MTPPVSSLDQLPSAWPWLPAEAPALCAPLHLPCLPALSLHCSPNFLSSVLFFPPVPCFLPVCVCLPFLCTPLPKPLSSCPLSHTSVGPSLSLSLPFFPSFWLSPGSVCLSIPRLCLPSLPPSLLAGLSPSLPCPASSVSLSPCLSLPLLSGKAAMIYELRTGPAAGAGGLDYSFPEEAACSGMAG